MGNESAIKHKILKRKHGHRYVEASKVNEVACFTAILDGNALG